MVPSKVYDVLVNVPATPACTATPCPTPALPIFARDLALSGNSSVRDVGMLAYISVNNAPGAGVTPGTAGSVFAAAQANQDTYSALVAGQPFTVSDPAKGVIANDINVYGVKLPTSPTNGTSDSFTYCANGTVTAGVCSSGITATVTLGASTLNSTLIAANLSYTSTMATYLKIPSPGLLAGGSDSNNLPFTVSAAGTTTPVTFTVVNPGTPILASITPASGLRRTAAAANPVAVVLTGSNFTAGSTVNVVAPANGLTVTGVTPVSPTQINATFNTTTTAAIGPRSITLTTPGGTNGTMTYTVLGADAHVDLSDLSPSRAGAAVLVSLFGSGLTGTTAVTVSGGGITVGPITVVGDTQINTIFTISAGAAGTARNVSVTAPGGTSNTVAFTVTIPATPTLASITPPTGLRGTAVPVTLTGTNFIVGETTVNVSGTGVTVSGVTTATAIFTITSTAAATARNVAVTAAGAAAASNAVPLHWLFQ